MRVSGAFLAAVGAWAFSGAAQAAEGEGGLPQLNAGDFAPQLIWLAVTFVLLLLIMSRVALPRIGEVLEERRDRIRRDLESAERLKGEAEAALAAYEKSLADARMSASGLARQNRDALAAEIEKERAKLDGEIASRVAAAEAQIAATKSKALASVNEIAAGTVTTIVEKLIGQNVSADEVARVLGRGPAE